MATDRRLHQRPTSDLGYSDGRPKTFDPVIPRDGPINASVQFNDLEKSDLLSSLLWISDSDSQALSYIEGYQHENLQYYLPEANFRTGVLAEQSLPGWLRQESSYERPELEHEFGKCIGGFRVLFCERSLGHPPIIECSRSGIVDVIDHFDLAPETVPSLVRLLGSFGEHYIVRDESSKRLQIIIKAFQKGELGNWTLSLTHDFRTSWTDALVIWTGWTSHEFRTMDRQWPSRFSHVVAQLKAVGGLWNHPTCLPMVLMQNYAGRCMDRCNSINQALVELDADLGVNQEGRLVNSTGLAIDWPAGLDFKKLTIGLHSATNSVVFVQQACSWTLRCLKFLLQLENDMNSLQIPDNPLSLSIIESLEYEISTVQGIADSFNALKARAQGATSVLFNASSQNDSMLNVKIAASTKEDSISMKTFTFLTALFLPGTFIATLLSVTMINWLPNSNGGPPTSASTNQDTAFVSKYYWIYWVLTVPITLLVMFGWFVWYRHANQRWLKQAGLPRIVPRSTFT